MKTREAIPLGEFLSELLQSQGEALLRLAAYFGEEILFEKLESEVMEVIPPALTAKKLDELRSLAAEGAGKAEIAKTRSPQVRTLATDSPRDDATWYRRLQSTVDEMKLGEPLEFHLWACPAYRQLVESEIPLISPLPHAAIRLLTEAASQWGIDWLARMPMPPPVRGPAEAAVDGVWARFRSRLLKKIGESPLS